MYGRAEQNNSVIDEDGRKLRFLPLYRSSQAASSISFAYLEYRTNFSWWSRSTCFFIEESPCSAFYFRNPTRFWVFFDWSVVWLELIAAGLGWYTTQLRLACVKVLQYTVFEQVKRPHQWISMVRHPQFLVGSKFLSQDLPNNFCLCSNCLSDDSIGFLKTMYNLTCCFNIRYSLDTSARVTHVVNRHCLSIPANTLIVRQKLNN